MILHDNWFLTALARVLFPSRFELGEAEGI